MKLFGETDFPLKSSGLCYVFHATNSPPYQELYIENLTAILLIRQMLTKLEIKLNAAGSRFSKREGWMANWLPINNSHYNGEKNSSRETPCTLDSGPEKINSAVHILL